ncbi:hypothetical protein Bca52824_050268 [Brassica carinata]|uniref:Uncharacterized protein n=1 Tax=Brassica carinata TaxID=52824 RepID=A0A8X7RRZ6_BRACI|nr:hypothetical protein Bca52824_050268 [Brassica carinata]
MGFAPERRFVERSSPLISFLQISSLFFIDSSRECLLHVDPAEERRDTKRHQEYINMLGNVHDSEYGIPRRCPCGGRMIDEVRVKEEHETHPGKRFFTCINYEVRDTSEHSYNMCQEEIEHLRKRVDEAEEVIKWVPNLKRQIESVEAQVKRLALLVDRLTGGVYNLTVQVDTMEKVCFD